MSFLREVNLTAGITLRVHDECDESQPGNAAIQLEHSTT